MGARRSKPRARASSHVRRPDLEDLRAGGRAALESPSSRDQSKHGRCDHRRTSVARSRHFQQARLGSKSIVTTKYEIQLDGVLARDLSFGVLRDLADLVVEGSSRAARLAAEGRSTARGGAPVWLAEASDVRLVGFRDGSLVLDVTARPLAEIAPGVFPTSTGETAFDLLMIAVDDALEGRRDSERLDLGMLQTLVKARSLFGRGARRLRLTRVGGTSIELAESAAERFQRLATETPPPKVDRIVGHLDSLTMSTRTCLLKLSDGTSLKGNVGASVDLDHLKGLLGLDVVVEGIIAFRPSGRPQRIEVDHVAAAQGRDALWERAPHGELPGEQLILPSDELGPSFGQWPGDEDDEQVFAALREIS
jgi:hypothetical protein